MDPDLGQLSDASERPLVVRFGVLGDMVLLTGLLDALSASWGSPCDVLAKGGLPRLVFAGLESVGEVFTLRSRKTPFVFSAEQRRLVRWLGRRGPSPTYLLDEKNVAKVRWLLRRGGVPRGHRLSMADLPRGDLEHVLHYYARVAGHASADFCREDRAHEPPPEQVAPRLVITADERRDCLAWLAAMGWEGQPLVLVQTRSRRRKRGRWPRESWVATIRGVLDALPEAWVLLIGAPAEEPPIESLRRDCGDRRVRNVAADLGLRRLFALATLAHSAISLDTGPAHVAAVLECPVAVLVGMADPRRNRPPGPPERVQVVTAVPEEEWPATRREWEAWHDVTAIRVPQVLTAWSRLQGRSKSP